jgi:Tfp pilus assembly protein PilX
MQIVVLIVLLAPLAILALLGLAAQRWGVDSRDVSTDPRRPSRPVGLRVR